VHALGIEPFPARHLEQRLDDVAADLGRARLAGDAEMIAATRDLDAESLFDLSQVFVELAAEIGQAFVIGGFQDHVAENVNSVQMSITSP
jgi:hypothetical protein